jgi:hypothetical protein
MLHTPLSITIPCLLLVGLAVPLIAKAENLGPCQQITVACKNAGFTQGGSGGHGLQRDCIAPIMQGTQPLKSAMPLPVVAPNQVAACKGKHPNFGQPQLPKSVAQIQELPAIATRPLATPALGTAQVPPSASTVTRTAALTVPAAGTGPYAVEIETTSGGRTSFGNATTVTFAAKAAVIQFAQDNQQAQAVHTCLVLPQCIRMTITETIHAHGGQATPLNVYTLTSVIVSHLARVPCAVTRQPCEGPILATFAFQQMEMKYLH